MIVFSILKLHCHFPLTEKMSVIFCFSTDWNSFKDNNMIYQKLKMGLI